MGDRSQQQVNGAGGVGINQGRNSELMSELPIEVTQTEIINQEQEEETSQVVTEGENQNDIQNQDQQQQEVREGDRGSPAPAAGIKRWELFSNIVKGINATTGISGNGEGRKRRGSL